MEDVRENGYSSPSGSSVGRNLQQHGSLQSIRDGPRLTNKKMAHFVHSHSRKRLTPNRRVNILAEQHLIDLENEKLEEKEQEKLRRIHLANLDLHKMVTSGHSVFMDNPPLNFDNDNLTPRRLFYKALFTHTGTK